MQTYDQTNELGAATRTGLASPANGLDQAGHEAGKLRGLLGDVADLVKAASTMSGDDLADAKARLSVRMAEARESMTELSGQLGERARGVARATDSYVRERPWRTLAIGAVGGLVLGLFFFRGRK